MGHCAGVFHLARAGMIARSLASAKSLTPGSQTRFSERSFSSRLVGCELDESRLTLYQAIFSAR
jgi:hypothetical protein